MKRIIPIMLVLMLLFLFVSCDSTTTSLPIQEMDISKQVEKFYGYIEKGDYEKAGEIYYDKISSTMGGENEVENSSILLSQKINEDYLKGNITREEAEYRKRILNEVKLYVHFVEPAEEYDSICFSKDKYDEGIDNMAMLDYIKAIECFEEVRVDDCNYSDAQKKISEAKENYKNEKLIEVASKIEEKKIAEAIKLLKESLDVLGEDDEIESMIKEYENEYVDGVIKEAEAVFKNPAKDWEKASQIIKQAQQHLPDNEALKKKREIYEQYAPVSLFDMHLFNQSSSYSIGTVTDNMGNTYEKAMSFKWTGSTNNYYNGKDVTKPMKGVFVLDKKYNKLEFTIAVEEADYEAYCYMTIRIYGDNNLLYDAGDLKGTTKPINKEIDVTGISDLEVRIDYNGPTGNSHYVHGGRKAIFANPLLQRTEK